MKQPRLIHRPQDTSFGHLRQNDGLNGFTNNANDASNDDMTQWQPTS